ncbi:MAG: hypothetical protein SXA11_08890 [Cyanobacteriota bacterium]|nr:hypothetical protein [Cyanobacteriota bacterium]
MSRIKRWLASHCPNLSSDEYKIISPETSDYNCIAWAAEEDDRWWDPTDPDCGYWPDGVPRELTLKAFIRAYETIGYLPCDNSEVEPGFQKVAIYAKEDSIDDAGQPTHAARQLPNGRWTSKIGEFEDIEHELDELRGYFYGEVVQILKRPIA